MKAIATIAADNWDLAAQRVGNVWNGRTLLTTVLCTRASGPNASALQ
jgi:hypothetical protein